jgi:acylphosphatase
MVDESRCLRITVRGHVQGVWFRYYTQQEAKRLDIGGWVRNRPDGSVEALICGNESQLARMQTWLTHGPERARVTHCESMGEKENESFSGFTIRH